MTASTPPEKSPEFPRKAVRFGRMVVPLASYPGFPLLVLGGSKPARQYLVGRLVAGVEDTSRLLGSGPEECAPDIAVLIARKPTGAVQVACREEVAIDSGIERGAAGCRGIGPLLPIRVPRLLMAPATPAFAKSAVRVTSPR